MKVPLIKATIAGIVTAGVSKFYTKAPNKDCLFSGLLTGASTVITDTLFSLITGLPSWFNYLGQYGQDFAAALLNTGIIALGKGKMAWIVSNGGLLPDFLISLGANVLAAYVEMPLAAYVPDSLSRFV